MKLAIMQPYFLPYIGYFQLLYVADAFVIYDNIQFTKKGWIHRNRLLSNGNDYMFTLPLKKDSDYLNVVERFLSENSLETRQKIVRRIENDYKKAPEFDKVMPLVCELFYFESDNLFQFILHSLKEINSFLGIDTTILVSSEIPIDHKLQSGDKVMAICKALEAETYINPSGGMELYDKANFKKEGLDLLFLQSRAQPYSQFKNEFVPWLSIIDVMMFNSKEQIAELLTQFELV